MSKDLEMKWGFIDKDNNLVEIPKNIEEHIKEREKLYHEQMVVLDSAYKTKIKELEKALELACKKVEERYSVSELAEGYGCNPKYFINKAKEMMKSE